MDTVSLKRYILDNRKIELILSSIGCHNIKYNTSKEYWSACHRDGDNPMGVVIYPTSYLNYVSFSRGISYEDSKDIINLIESSTNKTFVEAFKYLHEILGIEFTAYSKPEKKESKKDKALSILTRVLDRKRRVDVEDIQFLNEELVEDYVPLLHIDWFKEGIMPWARDKFGIAYSYRHKRVVIPLRYWATGDLLGFNQRTTVENFDELGIKKYYISPSYQKSLNLYGLYENKEEIEKKKVCVIVESEKSVLKRYSLNDGTCVALSGKTMSNEQKRIILGLDINEVVVALDNDVPIEEVNYICEQFYRARSIRKVSYIRDRCGLLKEKDSPCDAENETYNTLFQNRHAYGYEEHMKYTESLKE